MSKRKSPSNQETKSQLKKLKQLGLYKGDLRRKEPSRYSKKLVQDFADVLNGRAQVVTIPKRAGKKSKGVVKARREAKELAEIFGSTMRAKGGKVIVKTLGKEEKAYYSPKSKTIVTHIKKEGGKIESREYVKPEGGKLPELRENEFYSLPFNRGRNGVEYINRADAEEILALANQYENNPKNPYRGATGYIQLGYIGKKKRRKISKRKLPDNVVEFPKRRK